MQTEPRHKPSRAALAATVVAALIGALVLAALPRPARATSLGKLGSELGAAQAHAGDLAASLSNLRSSIARLDAQVTLVRTRESAVRAALASDRRRLATARRALARERARLARLRAELAHARAVLAGQLVSNYEGSRPDLVSVVLDSHGFTQLLEQLNFLTRAEDQQQQLIAVTRRAKARAQLAATRLARLESSDARTAAATATQARALAGMDALLASRRSALARARAAQESALAAADAQASRLRSAIAQERARQEAAARAAAAAAAAQSAASAGTAAGPSGSSAPSAAPSGGWAIPAAVVMCESGGQDLPPNSAGASGYYQIMPGTWRLFGGSGPAAYLASKAEQDSVAARIWNGGAGASNWVCAEILGIR